MAITTTLIGSLGGGVLSEEIGIGDAPNTSWATVTTLPIPTDVPHLIVVRLWSAEYSNALSGNRPTIRINGTFTRLYRNNELGSIVVESDGGPCLIEVQRGTTSSASSYSRAFTGIVYWFPMAG